MTAISTKYAQLGGQNGFLGAPTTVELVPPDGVGRFRHYQHGSIYWHPATGAHEIHGSIRSKWAELGWETGPLGYPTTDELDSPPGGRISRFQHGHIVWRPAGIPELNIYTQNMAMLPAPATYLGTNRSGALTKLTDQLRAERPHLVGLCELFVDGERDTVKSRLRDIYVGSVEGPDEADLESDGGLLLLSRYPIIESHKTIYRQYSGEDGFANKGAVHARVQVPGLPTPLDVFHTHTQNPNVGGKEAARGTLNRQFEQLRSFILSCRHPDNPAILMGDINTDMNNSVLRQDLMNRLQGPIDVWSWTGDRNRFPLGITSDKFGSFKSGSTARPVSDPNRHRTGGRIDAFLAWNGAHTWPGFGTTSVVVHQSSPGRDISDHYGVSTSINGFQSFGITVARVIRQVTVALHSFQCMEETDEVGSDEVYFRLSGKSQNGQSKTGQSGVRSGVDTGEFHSVNRPVTLTFNDPGSFLDISLRGSEQDGWPNPDDDMGTVSIRLTRQELLELVNRQVYRVMPRLTKDGGEYAMTITISVK